jgi:hypothetical protein
MIAPTAIASRPMSQKVFRESRIVFIRNELPEWARFDFVAIRGIRCRIIYS